MAEETKETVNQELVTEVQTQEERTFTQKEVDNFIKDRLARERAKYADYDSFREKAEKYDAAEEESKSELQKATEKAAKLEKQLNDLAHANEVQEIRIKVAEETGVPLELLTGEDEDSCKKQAEGIMKFAGMNRYPNIKDGGEIDHKKQGNSSTRDKFAEWFANSLGK